MSKDPKTQIINGHVFDSDGNPIGANLVLKRIEVDTVPCLSVSAALAEPGVWTVIGIYEDHREPYPDYPEPQFQRWAEVVKADSPDEAIAAVRKQLGDSSTTVVAACVAGDVRVVA